MFFPRLVFFSTRKVGLYRRVNVRVLCPCNTELSEFVKRLDPLRHGKETGQVKVLGLCPRLAWIAAFSAVTDNFPPKETLRSLRDIPRLSVRASLDLARIRRVVYLLLAAGQFEAGDRVCQPAVLDCLAGYV